MKKTIVVATAFLVFILLGSTSVFAQGMMGFPSSSPDSSTIQSQQAEEQTGKKLLDELNKKVITCQKLTSDNFEKIGEYFMGQAIGNTAQHISMNNMMTSMMGEQGEEQMHIAWGKQGSGCDTSAQLSQNGIGFMPMIWMMGGGNPMMGWGGSGFIGLFLTLFWLLVLVDLTLLGVWLWKKIRKEK